MLTLPRPLTLNVAVDKIQLSLGKIVKHHIYSVVYKSTPNSHYNTKNLV